jgi:hypothetical protein
MFGIDIKASGDCHLSDSTGGDLSLKHVDGQLNADDCDQHRSARAMRTCWAQKKSPKV